MYNFPLNMKNMKLCAYLIFAFIAVFLLTLIKKRAVSHLSCCSSYY